MTQATYDLVIIGAGPAGLTAALYAHRSGSKILVIGGDVPGGQVTTHYRVDNYPGFPGGVPGAQLMMSWLRQVIDETGSMPLPESVCDVDFSGQRKHVSTGSGEYTARSVIVATGARPRHLGIPGEDDLAGRGVYYCATCDAPLLRRMERRRTAVVGGGNAAFHIALALLPHAEKVTLIPRNQAIRATPALVDRFRNDPKAQIFPAKKVKSVIGEKHVRGLVLADFNTEEEITLPFEAVFVGVGQSPVTDFLSGALKLDDAGFIVTDDALKTSVPGVFAAGDVRVSPLRQIITAASDGALAAQSATQYLRMDTA